MSPHYFQLTEEIFSTKWLICGHLCRSHVGCVLGFLGLNWGTQNMTFLWLHALAFHLSWNRCRLCCLTCFSLVVNCTEDFSATIFRDVLIISLLLVLFPSCTGCKCSPRWSRCFFFQEHDIVFNNTCHFRTTRRDPPRLLRAGDLSDHWSFNGRTTNTPHIIKRALQEMETHASCTVIHQPC